MGNGRWLLCNLRAGISGNPNRLEEIVDLDTCNWCEHCCWYDECAYHICIKDEERKQLKMDTKACQAYKPNNWARYNKGDK